MKRLIIGCVRQTIGAGYADTLTGSLPSDNASFDALKAAAALRPYNLNDAAGVPKSFSIGPDTGSYWAGVHLSQLDTITHVAAIADYGAFNDVRLYHARDGAASVDFTWYNKGPTADNRQITLFHLVGADAEGVGDIAISGSISAGNVKVAELMGVSAVIMPTMAELPTFRRRAINAAYQEYKTLDGAVRKITTAAATTEIEIDCTWSDDGETAKSLNAVYTYAANAALPLVVAIVEYSSAAAYTSNDEIYLVTTTDAPEITQPEPGIYTTSIRGRVQP